MCQFAFCRIKLRYPLWRVEFHREGQSRPQKNALRCGFSYETV